jgi:hypothetical protein
MFVGPAPKDEKNQTLYKLVESMLNQNRCNYKSLITNKNDTNAKYLALFPYGLFYAVKKNAPVNTDKIDVKMVSVLLDRTMLPQQQSQPKDTMSHQATMIPAIYRHNRQWLTLKLQLRTIITV